MTESRIHILDSIVANQIAAGEVVERPGSVVKELIENALDAGADRIQLDLQGGGVARIRVLDNGRGIPADEVELAFTRHATSKITTLSDLDAVATYGFRGEALPSIASVSRFTVRTRTVADIAGQQLVIEGGKLIEHRETGCPTGTEVEVANLFFNTPARLKFLKSESTESSHSAEALVRLAAIRPDVSFKMTSAGRTVRQLPRVERIEERVGSMFGGERLVRAEGQEAGIRVLAILGPPERGRAGAGSLYTYVNNRFVRDKIMLRAITQAFAGTLENGRYPAGLVALELPAGSFDVNVHPQKLEVRFADNQAVYRAVQRVVGEMVSRALWTFADAPSLAAEPATTFDAYAAGHDAAPDAFDRTLVPPVRLVSRPTAPVPYAPPEPNAPQPVAHDHLTLPEQLPIVEASNKRPASGFARLAYIGQAKGLFLLFEDAEELVIVDQHAAHERVTFERLRGQLTEGHVTAQRLLQPHHVDLGPAEAERIVALAEELQRLGLEVVRAGADRIAIHAVPAELAMSAPDRLLADMVIAFEEGRKGSRGEAEEHVLATMACHGSLRAGRVVNEKEVTALLAEMDRADYAGHCPHGRPVLARIPWAEIRRRVHRN